jgi:hypothetical protein
MGTPPKAETMVEADTSNSSNFSNTDKYRFREAFVQVGNVFRRQPDAKFWAAERYCRNFCMRGTVKSRNARTRAGGVVDAQPPAARPDEVPDLRRTTSRPRRASSRCSRSDAPLSRRPPGRRTPWCARTP